MWSEYKVGTYLIPGRAKKRVQMSDIGHHSKYCLDNALRTVPPMRSPYT